MYKRCFTNAAILDEYKNSISYLIFCKSIFKKVKRDLGKLQVTTPVCCTLWSLVMSNGHFFRNRLYFMVLSGAGLLPKHY